MIYKESDIKHLLDACRHMADNVAFDDGNATVGTLLFELFERALHRIDPSVLPTRPDSSVDACPHACEYCMQNDVPS